jgi:hypothetical protein
MTGYRNAFAAAFGTWRRLHGMLTHTRGTRWRHDAPNGWHGDPAQLAQESTAKVERSDTPQCVGWESPMGGTGVGLLGNSAEWNWTFVPHCWRVSLGGTNAEERNKAPTRRLRETE